MNAPDTIAQLQAMGTAQNRKIYSRHGVKGEQFGVSYANLELLRKTIKVDQPLAEQLWASGNHDARVLATMIADPRNMSFDKLAAWAADLDNYVLTGALAKLASRTTAARACIEKWTAKKDEWMSVAGWETLACLAGFEETSPNAWFEEHLATIERTIHTVKNHTRHTMNGALIAIGLRNPALQAKALKAAAKIGKVEVDHGETSCVTPDATAYIKKAAGRKTSRTR